MTPEQRLLARHALGLDNPKANSRSYRNRYFASGDKALLWRQMELAGEAEFHPSTAGSSLFVLTHKGAALALDAGESLDPEDFP